MTCWTCTVLDIVFTSQCSLIVQHISRGTGVIIGSEGTILTNAHVLNGMTSSGEPGEVRIPPLLISAHTLSQISVILSDGRVFGGVIYGVDPVADLAVVKVTNATEMLPAASLATCDHMRTGDWVVAVGSSAGLDNTVTAGVVSGTFFFFLVRGMSLMPMPDAALARKGPEFGLVDNDILYIQSDATINSGNSGGPLVDVDGNVVGITTFRMQAADGIGIAIRLDSVQDIVRQLAEEGTKWTVCSLRFLTP